MCVGVHCLYGSCGSQKMASDSWNWSCRWLGTAVCALGTQPGSSEDQEVLLPAEHLPSLLTLTSKNVFLPYGTFQVLNYFRNSSGWFCYLNSGTYSTWIR